MIDRYRILGKAAVKSSGRATDGENERPVIKRYIWCDKITRRSRMKDASIRTFISWAATIAARRRSKALGSFQLTGMLREKVCQREYRQ